MFLSGFHVYILSAFVFFNVVAHSSKAQQYPPQLPPVPLSGVVDGRGLLVPETFSRLPLYDWCQNLETSLHEIINGVHMPMSGGAQPSAVHWRRYFVRSSQNLLSSMLAGNLAVKPLTYSVLRLGLLLDRGFPNTALGNQSAALVLSHTLRVAARVSAQFDRDQYAPYVRGDFSNECYGAAAADCGNEDFYVNYAGAANEVIAELFSGALSSGPRGTLLQAMGEDRWEMEAVATTLEWINEMLRADTFRRRTRCLSVRISGLSAQVRGYLAQPAGEFNDHIMNQYAEQMLAQIGGELSSFVSNGGCQ